MFSSIILPSTRHTGVHACLLYGIPVLRAMAASSIFLSATAVATHSGLGATYWHDISIVMIIIVMIVIVIMLTCCAAIDGCEDRIG